jgi:hypothetical protein
LVVEVMNGDKEICTSDSGWKVADRVEDDVVAMESDFQAVLWLLLVEYCSQHSGTVVEIAPELVWIDELMVEGRSYPVSGAFAWLAAAAVVVVVAAAAEPEEVAC